MTALNVNNVDTIMVECGLQYPELMPKSSPDYTNSVIFKSDIVV